MKQFFLFMEERFTKEELNDIISEMQRRDEFSSDEFIEYNYCYVTGTPESIIEEYEENLNFWFDYLIEYLDLEEYEFCSKIKNAIQLEKKNILELIYGCRYDLLDEKDFIETIKKMDTEKFKQI